MKIKWFKLSFDLHKYLGVTLCIFLVFLSVTGLFLTYKNAYAWMQAPTERGTKGKIETMIPLSTAVDKVMALGLPEFKTPDDINRIDIRLGKNAYKVRSKGHLPKEVQLDAQTGELLGVSTRWSDWIEHLHTGEMWGEMSRRLAGTVMGATMLLLSITGLVIWGYPMLMRQKRQAASRRERVGSA